MPIEFRCPSCSKLLRAPEESRGKKAKCPQCGTISDIPSGDGPLDPLGSTDPTQEFSASPGDSGHSFGQSDFGGEPLPNTADFNPYASPSAQSTIKQDLDSGPTKGLPWERGKSVKSFWETTKLIFSSPREAFTEMHRQGGFGDPLLFAIAGGLTGGLFSAIYGSALQVVLLGSMAAAAGDEAAMAGGMMIFQVIMQFVGAIAGGTIGVVIGCFVGAAIQHVCLLILGEKQLFYETTFRVGAYVTGCTSLLQVVPFCGQYVYGIVALVYTIIGLAAAHRITQGKAAAAVLLPILVCCVIAGVAVAIIFATVGFAAAGAGAGAAQ